VTLIPSPSPEGRGAQAGFSSHSPAGRGVRGEGLRPKEDELFAVPITKLYDNGKTVAPAKLLKAHIDRFNGVFVNPATAEKYGLLIGGQAAVSLGGVEVAARVFADQSISTGVVLIPRSFGIPIKEPVAVKLTAINEAQEA